MGVVAKGNIPANSYVCEFKTNLICDKATFGEKVKEYFYNNEVVTALRVSSAWWGSLWLYMEECSVWKVNCDGIYCHIPNDITSFFRHFRVAECEKVANVMLFQ